MFNKYEELFNIIMKDYNTSSYFFAKSLGVNKTTLNLISSNRLEPDTSFINNLSEMYNVSIYSDYYVLNYCNSEDDLLSMYKNLPLKDQTKVLNYIKKLSK